MEQCASECLLVERCCLTQLNLTRKVAAITGGASGIGKAIAQCFAAAGAQVRVLDFDGPAAARTVDEITSAGGNALAFECDVTDSASVDSVFLQMAARGAVDTDRKSTRLNSSH